MNDFATEEFITKNIRVRPISGVTRGGDMEETRTNVDYLHFGGAGQRTTEPNDDEEKFNKMINLDMEEQRRNIKVKKDEYNRKRLIEEEKKRKKKE